MRNKSRNRLQNKNNILQFTKFWYKKLLFDDLRQFYCTIQLVTYHRWIYLVFSFVNLSLRSTYSLGYNNQCFSEYITLFYVFIFIVLLPWYLWQCVNFVTHCNQKHSFMKGTVGNYCHLHYLFKILIHCYQVQVHSFFSKYQSYFPYYQLHL